MGNFFDQYFSTNVAMGLQTFVVALVILLIGWILSKVISNLVEKMLRKTNIDEKFFHKFQKGEKPIDSNKIIGKIVYYILLIITFMLFFNQLNLNMLASPLSDLISTFLNFIPAVLTAALILLVAWIIGSLLQWVIVKGTEKAKIQQLFYKIKLADTKEEVSRLMETVGKIVFYLILLMSIPGVLNALNITGIAQPFSGLLDTILAFIPKLIAAALIFAIGWFVAKIIKDIVTNLLVALGAERLIARLKLQKAFEGSGFSAFIGNLVFILIMIPITIAALEQLELRGITDPAISMLNNVMNMIPNILIAVGLVLVGIWLGRLIGGFVQDYLGRLGFNRLLAKAYVGNGDSAQSKMEPSAIAGYIVQVFIVFILTVQALFIVKLDFLVGIATAITGYLPNVLAAVLILGAALILSSIVEKVLLNLLSGEATKFLAGFAKYSILVLAVFMALTQLGIATTIVSSAFILILGGLALAFGLAFGLGGKEFASKYLQKFDRSIDQTEVVDPSNDEDDFNI